MQKIPNLFAECQVYTVGDGCRVVIAFVVDSIKIFLSVAAAMDGYSFLSTCHLVIYPEYCETSFSYTWVSKRKISHDNQLLEFSKGGHKDSRNQKTQQPRKLSDVFQPKRTISFLVVSSAKPVAIRTGTVPIHAAGYQLLDTSLH